MHRDVFAPASDEAKVSSIQLGQELAPLLHRSAEIARRFGYTDDQLAGNVVTVSDPSFIDATHAIVKFSLTIPDHGTVVKDRVGYAVQTDGRWQVAARTVCDIVWPGTTSPACPARAGLTHLSRLCALRGRKSRWSAEAAEEEGRVVVVAARVGGTVFACRRCGCR